MAKTIIQTIGPLYGDVVNGTVFGRPNGSVYVPPSNTIALTLADSLRFVKNDGAGYLSICSSSGSVPYPQSQNNRIVLVAQSQDSQNYIGTELATDSDFTDIVGTYTYVAGQFNILGRTFLSEETIVDETTYYLRAVLYSANGIAVSVSDPIELEGVA